MAKIEEMPTEEQYEAEDAARLLEVIELGFVFEDWADPFLAPLDPRWVYRKVAELTAEYEARNGR